MFSFQNVRHFTFQSLESRSSLHLAELTPLANDMLHPFGVQFELSADQCIINRNDLTLLARLYPDLSSKEWMRLLAFHAYPGQYLHCRSVGSYMLITVTLCVRKQSNNQNMQFHSCDQIWGHRAAPC
jgi:hypothetical protein